MWDRGIPVKHRILLVLPFMLGLFLIGCEAVPLWVKPGATEADLEMAKSECQRRYVAGRFGFSDPVVLDDPFRKPVDRPGRGAWDMAQDRCLEEQGWEHGE